MAFYLNVGQESIKNCFVFFEYIILLSLPLVLESMILTWFPNSCFISIVFHFCASGATTVLTRWRFYQSSSVVIHRVCNAQFISLSFCTVVLQYSEPGYKSKSNDDNETNKQKASCCNLWVTGVILPQLYSSVLSYSILLGFFSFIRVLRNPVVNSGWTCFWQSHALKFSLCTSGRMKSPEYTNFTALKEVEQY